MTNDRQAPLDIIERFGYLPDHKYRGGNEHSSACPKCGGAKGGRDLSDRFRFWERQGAASNFWCRRCGFQGFTDDDREATPDLARIKELEEIRQRETAKEAERLQAKIVDLQQRAYWRGYHDAMSDQQRELWRRAGVPNEFQDYWQLGYKAEYRGQDFISPALTIPYFGPNWEAQTIQYRLLDPPAPADKYRFQAGLKSSLWLADPNADMSGGVILCEGMKKAAVTFIELIAKANGRYTVVAVPSKAPGADLLATLQNADPLYIVLDPDAYSGRTPAVNRLVKMITAPKIVVKLPVKADDFFVEYGGTAVEFFRFIDVGVTI